MPRSDFERCVELQPKSEAGQACSRFLAVTHDTFRRHTDASIAEISEMEPLGRYLKRERELRQISVAEVAQTTRIPQRIIAQLENDELECLACRHLRAGYLRAYARAVSLDRGGCARAPPTQARAGTARSVAGDVRPRARPTLRQSRWRW